ncbi:flagellar biosynthesis protein FlhF [Variovorax ginsengisoli]|uniref:Flagellar biosynthesis protein FlhF n=1 Tax=Variovorax ginsengisoli TaxID=363844 RepID=A0ABT9SD89_9BURK|nr:flagellar biosynthesis protein FlhF [Variovorax ginsengisoli]MDP9902321.1 flagellar biosynthesis protein FlhF [Variovorax ginsengisoli]
MTQSLDKNATRKFVAPTAREALRLAREALGPEAMVLNSRLLADGIEIVAMAPDDLSEVVDRTPPAPAFVPVAAAVPPRPAVPPAAPAIVPAPAVAAEATTGNDALLTELHSMRGMIEEQLASVVWNDKQRRDPLRGRLLRTLLGAGFSARLSKAMLEKFPTGQTLAQGMAFIRSELIRAVPVQADEDALLAQGGVYALMGPTGVGKTTTTAKLAARCVMRFGADKLALVTTDGYRIGAYEQLRIYGKILDVPVHAVKDAADLQLVLHDLRDKHMVLIDTVGMSQRDRAVPEQIAMLNSGHRPVKRLLLLNATSHGDTLNEVVHAYRHAAGGAELSGCIFTKVDEATHPGALIDTVIRHRLPVHYVSSGQKVPENLMLADRESLIDSVFQAHSRSALFVPGEADLQDRAEPAAETVALMANEQAESERLRHRYQKLIQAMAHDAEELGAIAQSLEEAPLGFVEARDLWRFAGDAGVAHGDVVQKLGTGRLTAATGQCDRHVLALTGQASLRAGDEAFVCHASLLLSDRNGLPFAMPNQWLATASVRDPKDPQRHQGARQVLWASQQPTPLPMVHLLTKAPSMDMALQWHLNGVRWLARAAASTVVTDHRTGMSRVLSRLDFSFGAARPVSFRGKVVLQREAQVDVMLRPGIAVAQAADAPLLRCVAVQLLDPRTHKLLSQCFMLSNLASEVSAEQLARWNAWGLEAEGCFRLLRHGAAALGGLGELGDPELMKRLMAMGQVCTTVWRLLQTQAAWAARSRALLVRLTGRITRGDRPLPGSIAFAGMGKLFLLLDALGSEPAQAMQVAAVGHVE